MCRGKKGKANKEHRIPTQKGFFKGFLCKDLFAQEIKFNIKGHTEVPSFAGQMLSLVVRLLVITFAVERMLAWYSFDKFKI